MSPLKFNWFVRTGLSGKMGISSQTVFVSAARRKARVVIYERIAAARLPTVYGLAPGYAEKRANGREQKEALIHSSNTMKNKTRAVSKFKHFQE